MSVATTTLPSLDTSPQLMGEQQTISSPQSPNLMVAPPPRPMYNPTGGSSSAQYGGANINRNAKRGLDGIGNQHNMTMGSTNMNNNTGDSTKRQKVNPYNPNSNGRASL